MQTSAMKACFQIAECSFSSAKVVRKAEKGFRFLANGFRKSSKVAENKGKYGE